MAEYIEREALIEGFKKHFDADYTEDGKLLYSDHICTGEDVEDLIEFVNEQPTADVVPVVRCKDCKRCEHFYPACDENGNYREAYYCKSIKGDVKPTDYCSYGERKKE